jgi:hypothetical protein
MDKLSALRALIRAGVVCATAFGLKLSADQVAGIQLLTEAIIQAVAQFVGKPAQP